MPDARQFDLVHDRGLTRIWIGADALDRSRAELSDWVRGRRAFVISSAPVRELHGEWLERELSAASAVTALDVADGEAGKTLDTMGRLAREMVAAGGKRDSRLLTLGGGSVGDVGGFAAACFLRGIEYAHVPTTLLAQVDASIGGKTGVNLPEAKNSVGAFHQPRFVIADARTLSTLPRELIRQGLFEVVKAAILADSALFDLLEVRLRELLEPESESLGSVVEAAAAIKIAVVSADEREADRRRLLNLGHTLGHALETCAGHGALAHGDAVGHGMLFAVELALPRGLRDRDAQRIRALVGRLAPARLPSFDPDSLIRAMSRDKKARETGLSWVLPLRVGAAEVVDDLDPALIGELLASFLTGFVESR